MDTPLQPSTGCNPSAHLMLFTEENCNKSWQPELRSQPPLTLKTRYLPCDTHKHKHMSVRASMHTENTA